MLICGTGQGMAMAANKVKGARAALCYEELTALMSREHNNSNILASGAWLVSLEKGYFHNPFTCYRMYKHSSNVICRI